MQPEHPKQYFGVLKGRPGEQKFAPELVIHRAVIGAVQPADVDRQAARKQHLGLDNVASPPRGAPDRADFDEVPKVVHSPAMLVERPIAVVDIQAVSNVNDSGIESDPAGVRRERMPLRQVVAVDPGGVGAEAVSNRVNRLLWPPSGSLTHAVSQGSYFRMMSTEPSVLPPSSTKYSRFG